MVNCQWSIRKLNHKHSPFTIDHSRYYSVLKLFTGFATAALMDWKLIVINAINNANNPAITNTQPFIEMR